jgi:hypothetical protein
VELEQLRDEYEAQGVGPGLLALVTATVRAVVARRRYPASYSPSGRWDEDALSGLVTDWATEKLLARDDLGYLLLANTTLSGLRWGLERSFVQYLLDKRQRTEIGNLFQRSNALLERDDRFRCFAEAERKADRLWGLAAWRDPKPFNGRDEDLIHAAFDLRGFVVVRFGPEARKNSPILLDADLGRFLEQLLDAVGVLLRLSDLVVVFRYRFGLLDASVSSLDEPGQVTEQGSASPLGATLASPEPSPEEQVVVGETTDAVLHALTPRQQRALLEYARDGATLENVARMLDCSKSTVENEVKRSLAVIRERAEGDSGLARAVYAEVLERLSDRGA